MRVRVASLVAALVAAGAIFPAIVSGQARSLGDCLPAGSTGAAVTGDPIATPIKFQAIPPAATRNFGAARKPVNAVFKLTTESALPKDLEKRLELFADPILRVGETTNSASFPEPTFSALQVYQNRKTVRFRVCLDPKKELAAGKYVGAISLEGPPGVDSSTMTITANAKNGDIFMYSAIVSLLFAFFILLYKGANDVRALLVAEAEKLPNNSDGTPTDEKAKALADAEKFWPAALRTVMDPRWLVPTLFALGAAFGALWGIYDANPSWGETGPVTSGFAVIGAGLAAIGARTIFTEK